MMHVANQSFVATQKRKERLGPSTSNKKSTATTQPKKEEKDKKKIGN